MSDVKTDLRGLLRYIEETAGALVDKPGDRATVKAVARDIADTAHRAEEVFATYSELIGQDIAAIHRDLVDIREEAAAARRERLS